MTPASSRPRAACSGGEHGVTLTPQSCGSCSLGTYAASTSQFCPFVIRRYRAGTELFSAARPAPDHVWRVMDGVVGLCHSDQPQRVAELRLPGSMVGEQATTGHVTSARVLTEATLCGAPRSVYERWTGEVRASEQTVSLNQRNVTCPNSAHLERIAYSERDDGTIARIETCSAFGDDSAVSCDQLCATRLNLRVRTTRKVPEPAK